LLRLTLSTVPGSARESRRDAVGHAVQTLVEHGVGRWAGGVPDDLGEVGKLSVAITRPDGCGASRSVDPLRTLTEALCRVVSTASLSVEQNM
jgi:hypothetical protein